MNCRCKNRGGPPADLRRANDNTAIANISRTRAHIRIRQSSGEVKIGAGITSSESCKCNGTLLLGGDSTLGFMHVTTLWTWLTIRLGAGIRADSSTLNIGFPTDISSELHC